jgi:putative aldouronate transport system substrate-binding protein
MENGKERIVILDSENYAVSNFWAAWSDDLFLQFRGGPPKMDEWKAEWSSRIKDGVGTQKYRALGLDTSAVDTEYGSLNNVMLQYWNPLSLGLVDINSGLAEYKANMEAAGIEKVREYFQKQLDDYVASLK